MPDQHNLIARYLNLKPGAANALLAAFCGCAVAAMAIHVIADMPVNIAGVSTGIVSVMLWFSAVGGLFFGWLSDHVGRKPILLITTALLSASILLRCLPWNYTELLSLHAIMGFAFGGVWTAGAVLTGEWADPAHRGKTVALIHCGWAAGWIIALLSKLLLVDAFRIPSDIAWRLMSVLGLAPMILVYFIWRFVDDAEVFKNSRHGDLAFTTLGQKLVDFANHVAHLRADFSVLTWLLDDLVLSRRWSLTFMLSTGAQAGYYAITFRLPHLLPDFLAQAGHKVASTDWYFLTLAAGSFAGYMAGGWASDHFGQRPIFIVFAVGTIATVGYLSTQWLNTDEVLTLAFLLGFFASGVFAGFNAFLTELFPTRTRGRRQGTSYNFGRRAAAYGVLLIGWFDNLLAPPGSASARSGLPILVFVAIAYALVIAAAWLLPETRGRKLDDDEAHGSAPGNAGGHEGTESP
jgi:MFS family permease